MIDYASFESEEHRSLRRVSREALHRLGMPSNPMFTNRDIVDGLSHALGMPLLPGKEAEHSEQSAEAFRDCLGRIIGLELPITTGDVVSKLGSFR